ncbi:diaminopimelate epimerase [Candidatus Bathyarchaeota archaeon]|nr:diaminopimelate epimerase [Candidatus Bathyarchaeota archaeon]
MSFWKMHGLGNDYVVIDNRSGLLNEGELSSLAVRLCERRFGIGADGLLLIYPSQKAEVKMRIFNPDGTEAEMCGNGIRCLAKYCFENSLVQRTSFLVETLAGVRTLNLKIGNNNVVEYVKVDMGSPNFEADKIPIKWNGAFINKPLNVGDKTFYVTALSMGNPHCVIFVEDVKSYPVADIGPILEKHELFPRRTNVEFVQVVSNKKLKVRVWERSVGETLACGTGACASVVAANILGKVGETVVVELLGGELTVEYHGGVVFMEGPAEKVFEGVINL